MDNVATQAQRGRKGNWHGLALVAGCLPLVVLAVWMIVAPHTRGRIEQDPSKLATTGFEEATGVRVLWVALTAGGGMIDLRYRVIDPDKALIVHDQNRPPRIIDEATGRTLSRPWMQHAHKKKLRTAVTYHQLLMNSGGVIKRQSPVTVVIGEARLEGVVVQ